MIEEAPSPPDQRPEFRDIPCPYCGTPIRTPRGDNNGITLANHLKVCPNNPDLLRVPVRKKR